MNGEYSQPGSPVRRQERLTWDVTYRKTLDGRAIWAIYAWHLSTPLSRLRPLGSLSRLAAPPFHQPLARDVDALMEQDLLAGIVYILRSVKDIGRNGLEVSQPLDPSSLQLRCPRHVLLKQRNGLVSPSWFLCAVLHNQCGRFAPSRHRVFGTQAGCLLAAHIRELPRIGAPDRA